MYCIAFEFSSDDFYSLWLLSGTKFIYLVKNHSRKILLKGQMKSECIYEIIDFPKYHRKI